MPDIETNTNKLLREKYFVDAEDVLSLGRNRQPALRRRTETGRVIDASRVIVSPRTVSPRALSTAQGKEGLKVHVVKENNRMVGIKIECPCGRHAELNCEYEPDKL
jgi:hypothetical protein